MTPNALVMQGLIPQIDKFSLVSANDPATFLCPSPSLNPDRSVDFWQAFDGSTLNLEDDWLDHNVDMSDFDSSYLDHTDYPACDRSLTSASASNAQDVAITLDSPINHTISSPRNAGEKSKSTGLHPRRYRLTREQIAKLDTWLSMHLHILTPLRTKSWSSRQQPVSRRSKLSTGFP